MPEGDIQTVLSEAFRRVNELSRRLRVLEERYDMSETKSTNLQDAIIRLSAANKAKTEEMSERTRNIEDRLLSIGNEIAKLNKLVEKCAKQSEVAELHSLVELYAPFKQEK